MAFPTVAATETSSTLASATQVVDLPTGISAGHLLVILMSMAGTVTATTPSGWTLVDPFPVVNGSTVRLYAFWKIATGSEGSTQNVTVSAATTCTHLSLRITGAHATSAPQGDTESTGTSSNADAPNNNRPAGAADHLWIAVEGGGSTPVASAAPTNYSGLITSSSGVTSISAAHRQLNAAAENPGAFTKTISTWVANTIVVYPAPEFRDAAVTIALSSTLAVVAAVLTFRNAVVAIAMNSTMTAVASVTTVVNAAVTIALNSTMAVSAGVATLVDAAVTIALSSTMSVAAGVATYVNAAVSIALNATMAVVANLAVKIVPGSAKWRLVSRWIDPDGKTVRGRWREV